MSLPQLNDEFPSLKAFKAAVTEYSIKEHFVLDVLQSNAKLVRYSCRSSAECSFRINCNWYEASTTVTVSKVVVNHTCFSSVEAKRAPAHSVAWLVQTLPTLITVRKDSTTKAIKDILKIHCNATIPDRQIQRARAEIVGLIQKEMAHDYNKIPDYFVRLKANQAY